MARSEDDLFTIQLQTTATVSLDWERIEQDPVFRTILATYGQPEDEEGYGLVHRMALLEYLNHYLRRERFLRDMPSTNGPGTVSLDNILGIEKL